MNNILWRPWNDPLAPLLNRSKSDEPDDEDDDELIASQSSFATDETYRGPCIVGPMGVVPIHECNTPSRLHNFWVGHCKIPITHFLAEVIAEVPGVESLDIYTRYRFRVGFGLAFRTAEVKANIEKAVSGKAVKQPKSQFGIQKMLSQQFPYWGTCHLPNGAYDYAGGETPEEVRAKLKKYEKVANVTLVWSWES